MRAPASSLPSVAIVAALLVLLALVLASDRSHAAIHACILPGGGTVFQDRPCDERPASSGAASTRRDAGGGGRRSAAGRRAGSASADTPPAGLHPSWFERPAGSSEPVRCDEAGCRCGSIHRSFDGGLALAVADALYLDGAWHRHATRLASRPSDAGAGRPGSAVGEAACDVMMSQDILATHAESVLRALQRTVREAEERGFDDPRVCERGELRACDHLDAIALYRRMVPDLAALRVPRERTSGPAGGEPGGASGGGRDDRPFDAAGRRFGTFPER